PDKGLPRTWSDGKNIVWKTPLPGAGASSPVAFGDRIYLTCYSGYGVSRQSRGDYENLKRHVICLSRQDGRILWDEAFSSKVPDDHYGDFTNRHGYTSSTPAVDETGVYVFFGTWGARAYSFAGGLKWERSCGKRSTNFGSASSPVKFDDLVILNAAVESQALIALDKASGREVWRAPISIGESRSTPLLLRSTGAPQLVYHFGEAYEGGAAKPSAVGAVDPRNGSPLWQCMSLNANLNPIPVENGGVIYAIAIRAVAIRAGGRGDVTGTHLLWDIKQGSEVATPVFYEDHLYWANQDGIAYCVAAKSGDVVYQERLNPSPGPIYASGVIADGKLYYVSRENGAYVLPAEPRFELLAHNTIETDKSVFNATPAISRGQLLLRSDNCLYCVGQK
ncbi:MAG: PQQ-binding-like beta-propeller repeat protein, partial [Pirellulales bacterium]